MRENLSLRFGRISPRYCRESLPEIQEHFSPIFGRLSPWECVRKFLDYLIPRIGRISPHDSGEFLPEIRKISPRDSEKSLTEIRKNLSPRFGRISPRDSKEFQNKMPQNRERKSSKIKRIFTQDSGKYLFQIMEKLSSKF